MRYTLTLTEIFFFFFGLFLNPEGLRQLEEKLPYRVVFQIIFVQKVSLELRRKLAETVAEKIHLLLDKPPPEILPEIKFRLYRMSNYVVSLPECILSGILYHLHHYWYFLQVFFLKFK